MATALTQTTTSAAIDAKATIVPLTSATGISAGDVTAGTVGTMLYIVDPGQQIGEPMTVLSISGSNATVSRIPGKAVAHKSGAMVLAGPPQAFYKYDPTGTTDAAYSPWVNVYTGSQWLYSSVLSCWIPGWGNSIAPAAVSTAVASANGTVTPSGPLFHITGANAITGFVVPVGNANHAPFTVIPDGTFTWTTGDGSIALAGTAVVNKALTFVFDGTNSKWIPSYIA